MALFNQEANPAMVFSAGRFRQLGFINHVIGFTIRRHPAQRFFEARGHALDKPGAYNGVRTALEERLASVFTIDAGFFRALATQHFRIDKAFSADPAVIRFYRRLITRRAGYGTPRRGTLTAKAFTLAIVTFTIATAALFFIARRAVTTVNTRLSWTSPSLPGTRLMGTSVRIIITADIHHFDLAAFIFQFVVAHSFSPPALREARRLPDVSSLSHYFI